jgi:hypothetical protein
VDARVQGSARPGGTLGVALGWRADAPIGRDLSVFVHLVDRDGVRVAQHDGAPADGVRPTRDWRPGETIADRHGLFVPEGARTPLGLLIGLYDAAGRLRTPEGAESLRLDMPDL